MSARTGSNGAASSVVDAGRKLTGAQQKALCLLTNWLEALETLDQLQREAAMDLSSPIALIRSARYHVAEKFNL